MKDKPIGFGIVGAGFAGLRCADVLLQHGFRVTILEARNRLGGRVAQSDHLGRLVDLGPNWIHGSNDNAIHSIAKETGTMLHAWDEESSVLDPNGNLVDPDEVEEHLEKMWENGVIAEAFRYSKENESSIEPHRSLYDFFLDKSEELFSGDHGVKSRHKRAHMWGAYVGSPVTTQSLRYFWLEECIEGENPFVAETYNKILEHVAAPAKQGAEIRYGRPVTKIVSTVSPNGRSKVTVRDPHEMSAARM